MPHPKNLHNGRYNFDELIAAHPLLAEFVDDNGHGEQSICFFDPKAVKALNQALLLCYYGVAWDIPPHALTPPIPGRADYIHYLSDLIGGNKDSDKCSNSSYKGDNKQSIQQIYVLDIGVGANCIYPIIGASQYGWHFVGSDIEKKSIKSAQQIIDRNPHLQDKVTLRHQNSKNNIFKGIITSKDHFDATMCNPPFHDSAQSAERGTMRKLRNLKGEKHPKLNFGGRSNELWCEGGELKFITNMIVESVEFKSQCRWFTTLVSKESNLQPLKRELKKVGASTIRTIDMEQGNKRSRILAWCF